ncbi:hypothetical protein DL93DRAFT_2163019 [Clavulina sp. PMI_390]|nr:hypothetical protein DL93DRAFT_2163019 [Clavulina sp. PMI_390]
MAMLWLTVVGSILSNLLFILGLCFFAAGQPNLNLNGEASFQESVTNVSTTLLMLSVSAILIPGSFHWVLKSNASFTAEQLLAKDLSLSRGVAVVLILLYLASLVFQFRSHKHMFESAPAEPSMNPRPRASSKFVPAARTPDDGMGYSLEWMTSPDAESKPRVHDEPISTVIKSSQPQTGDDAHFRKSAGARAHRHDVERQPTIQTGHGRVDVKQIPNVSVPTAPLEVAVAVLVIVTGIVANNVRFLINSMNGLTDLTSGHMQHSWVALILLPIAGNVVDHVMTITHTFKDDLDLAIALAFGASIQMALGVIPFLVLVAWAAGKPLTLLWDPFQGIVLLLTTLNVSWVVSDGKANWLEGLILMALYVLVAVAFWWYPDSILPVANCT